MENDKEYQPLADEVLKELQNARARLWNLRVILHEELSQLDKHIVKLEKFQEKYGV